MSYKWNHIEVGMTGENKELISVAFCIKDENGAERVRRPYEMSTPFARKLAESLIATADYIEGKENES